MSTTLERETSQIQPERPWAKQNKSTLVANLVAVTIPTTLLAILFFVTDIPGPVLVVAFFFPVQLLTAGVTTFFVSRQTRTWRCCFISCLCYFFWFSSSHYLVPLSSQ